MGSKGRYMVRVWVEVLYKFTLLYFSLHIYITHWRHSLRQNVAVPLPSLPVFPSILRHMVNPKSS